MKTLVGAGSAMWIVGGRVMGLSWWQIAVVFAAFVAWTVVIMLGIDWWEDDED